MVAGIAERALLVAVRAVGLCGAASGEHLLAVLLLPGLAVRARPLDLVASVAVLRLVVTQRAAVLDLADVSYARRRAVLALPVDCV